MDQFVMTTCFPLGSISFESWIVGVDDSTGGSEVE